MMWMSIESIHTFHFRGTIGLNISER